MIKQLKLMDKITPKKNAVFVLFYCDDSILILNRRNNKIGFPGGMVDGDETFKEAAVREVFEEIGHVVEQDSLTPLCSHLILDRELGTHLFTSKVSSIKELKNILANSINGRDFMEESTGVMLVDTSMEHRIKNLMEYPMASTVKEEIEFYLDLK